MGTVYQASLSHVGDCTGQHTVLQTTLMQLPGSTGSTEHSILKAPFTFLFHHPLNHFALLLGGWTTLLA